VVTNAIRYGRPPVGVRLWARSGQFVCTVTDHGDGVTDPFAGYIWPGSREHIPTRGVGLWLARRLCDRVDVFDGPTAPGGTTVRLIIRDDSPGHRPNRHRRTGTG
jgi:anti-sigma regulatory factor (Ser/Thr protein kinase)